MLFVDALVGGEVSGVMTAELAEVPLSVARDVEEGSLVLDSCEWVAAGVSGGDCIMAIGGEAWGDGKPDSLVSRPLRSLESRDATCKGAQDG